MLSVKGGLSLCANPQIEWGSVRDLSHPLAGGIGTRP